MSLRSNLSDDQARSLCINVPKNIDDLPPPGSRGGPDDIAAPVQSADEVFKNMAEAQGVKVEDTILPTGKGLEAIKNVQNNFFVFTFINF